MKRARLLYIICFCLSFSSMLHAQHGADYNILQFGAVSEKSGYSTMAIQQAIEAAGKKGGGRVVIPPGRFLTGTILLRSGVELYLSKEAVLVGSPEIQHYRNDGKINALICAENITRVAITGEGVIDGQSDQLIEDILQQLRLGKLKDPSWLEYNGKLIRRPSEWSRPKLIYFLGCDSIQIKGITLQNGTCWIQEYKNCSRMLIDGIKVESTTYWNNDGIDLTDCRDVLVQHCNINAADDAICLKSDDRASRCENITIRNCQLRSSANAVKLGTASYGGFRNIRVFNIDVYDTYRSAVALEAVDGGVLENILVDGVRARNTGNALFIRLGHRNKDSVYSRVSGIQLRNVDVQVPAGKPDAGYRIEGPLLKYPPGFKKDLSRPYVSVSPWNHSWDDSTAVLYLHNVFPASVTGLPGHMVNDVLLENITIRYAGGADSTVNYFPPEAAREITNAETAYPEFSMFGELPAWGLFVRHVQDIRMHNIVLIQQQKDYRPALLFLQSTGINLRKTTIQGNQYQSAIMEFDAGFSKKSRLKTRRSNRHKYMQ